MAYSIDDGNGNQITTAQQQPHETHETHMTKTTKTTKTTTRTITLTDRRPVKIKDADWDLIAESRWYDGQIESQANRSGWLKVRQHADGRAIVYGSLRSSWQNETCLRGGELLAKGADLAAAINRVAETCNATSCAAECIADLPAEEI